MTAHLYKSLTRDALSKAFGVSTQTISNWYKRGMPRNRDKTYCLPDCFAWCVDQAKQGSPAEEKETDESTKWLTEFRKERAILTKLQREAEEKKLLPREDVAEAWQWRVSEVKNGLMGLVDRLPPLLEGKSLEEARDILEHEMWEILDRYSREGRFCQMD